MNNNNRWDLDEIIYLIQFILFYITVVGGIVLIILAAIKKISFPVIGAILIYAVVVFIQLAFMIVFSKPIPDDAPLHEQSLESESTSVDDEIEKEIAEIKELKARLKQESELRKNP